MLPRFDGVDFFHLQNTIFFVNQQNLPSAAEDNASKPYATQHCITLDIDNRTAIELMVCLIQCCRFITLTWHAIELYKTIVEKWPGTREIIMSKEEMTVQEFIDRLKKAAGM